MKKLRDKIDFDSVELYECMRNMLSFREIVRRINLCYLTIRVGFLHFQTFVICEVTKTFHSLQFFSLVNSVLCVCVCVSSKETSHNLYIVCKRCYYVQIYNNHVTHMILERVNISFYVMRRVKNCVILFNILLICRDSSVHAAVCAQVRINVNSPLRAK